MTDAELTMFEKPVIIPGNIQALFLTVKDGCVYTPTELTEIATSLQGLLDLKVVILQEMVVSHVIQAVAND